MPNSHCKVRANEQKKLKASSLLNFEAFLEIRFPHRSKVNAEAA
jgi:hypothetical protein